MHRIRRGSLIAVGLICSCESMQIGASDDAVNQFVAGQHLSNAQPARVAGTFAQFDASIFYVGFGPIGTCLRDGPTTAGGPCSIYTAVGLAYHGRIGWLHVYSPDTLSGGTFQFNSTDQEIFGPDFAAALRTSSSGAYYFEDFTFALIRSPVTPRETLLRLTGELTSFIWPPNSLALMQRSDVRQDAEILGMIANLPVYQGDAYAGSRIQARALLDSLAGHE